MLTTRVQSSIELQVPGKYLGTETYTCVCYGDDRDKNIFYVLPLTVVFASRMVDGERVPAFSFYKYRGVDLNGGYATFTTQLPIPDEGMQDEIRAALFGGGIQKALEGKSLLAVKMCAARTASEDQKENQELATKYQTALNLSGLSQEEADKLFQQYDGDPNNTKQFIAYFMPQEVSAIQLKTIDVKSISAALIIDQTEALYQSLPASVNPTGTGNNDAIFSLSLTKEGAKSFEDVLKGSETNATVGVIYTLNFDSSLQAVQIKVTYHSKAFKEFTQTIKRHTWSADEKEITRKFTQNEGANVDVNFMASKEEMGMKQEEFDQWKQGLRDWGQAQLAQILTSQTGLDMNMSLINDNDGYDKFKSSLDQTKDFVREYKENTVVNYVLYPQAQLASIKSIVGEENLDNYFKSYDTRDPFYDTLEPEFIVNGEFDKYNIANVVVNVSYNGEFKESLLFEKGGEKKKTTPWPVDHDLDHPREFTYNYKVSFNGTPAIPFESGDITVDGELIVNINTSDSGVVYVDVNDPTENIWEVFEKIILDAQYSSQNPPVDKKEEIQEISKANNAEPYIYPTGVEQTEAVYYQLQYYTKNGDNFYFLPSGDQSPTLPDFGATKAQQLFIANPLPRTVDLKLFLLGFPEATQLFVFDLVIKYPNIKFEQSISATETNFSSGTIEKKLSYQLMDSLYNDDVIMNYKVTAVVDGQQKEAKGELKPSDTIKLINFSDLSSSAS